MRKTLRGAALKGDTIFILHVRMTINEPHIWDPRFAFHASGDAEAKAKADKWARYHGMTTKEVAVQRVETEAELPYTEGFIRDEWIPRS